MEKADNIDSELAKLEIIIREVHPIVTPWGRHYIASVVIKDGDWVSHVFQVDFKDINELHEKLMKDLHMYLNLKRSHGEQVARRV